MKLFTIISAFIIGSKLAQAADSASCPLNYFFTKERGCIKSCSHPDFKNCADAYPAIWDPKYCALGWDGQWKSFTYACQACGGKPKRYSGVANGEC